MSRITRIIRASSSILASAALVALATGCFGGDGDGADGGSDLARQRSQFELRAYQTRDYDVEDHKLVMKAMINALQDLGYIIETAEAELGVVTARKWTNVEHTKKAVKKAQKDGAALPANVMTECSANVSPFGKQNRVRLTFQQRVLGPDGAVMRTSVIEDPAFYQEFFARVDKSVFVQREGL